MILSKLRGELIDVIQWIDDSRDTLVWRFERHNNEIKMGAKLVVRESQAAVFIDQGQLADVFPPGTYTLTTANLPILSTLKGWAHGFQSPFKSEVYFVSTRLFTNLKWGTKNPLMLRDPEFGPIRVRAFGTFTMRITDPAGFIRNVSGTEGQFTVEGVSEQLRNLVVSRLADVLGASQIPVLDLAANYEETGRFLTERIAPLFQEYGIEIRQLLIENVSLPPEVEKALDKRSSMGILGNLQQYTQYQIAEAIPQAAQNPGGLAGAGLGLGAGMAMGQQMAGAMQAGPASSVAGPPPLPGQEEAVWHVARDSSTQAGPFPLASLRQEIQQQRITAATLVWKPGMASWTPAGEVAELQALFAQVPPPLPG